MASISPSEPLDYDSLSSGIDALTNILRNSDNYSSCSPSGSENLLQDCVASLEEKVKQVVSQVSDAESTQEDEFDACLEHLREDLLAVEVESSEIFNEIEGLRKAYVEGTCKLESDIEKLKHELTFFESKGAFADIPKHGEEPEKLSRKQEFEIWDLCNQVTGNEKTLKSLEDLDCALKRFEAIEKISKEVTGLDVISFEGNFIRMAMKTYISNDECLMYNEVLADTGEPFEMNHELLIEVMDGTMEIKNVEILPGDICLAPIIEADTSFREVSSALLMPKNRSSLGWFLQKVRDRIVICTVRRLVLKSASKSRHSLEYSDMDELIIAHMVGGVDAFIKPTQGWPILGSALKLVGLKASDQTVKEISLSLQVKEAANSLDSSIRRSITDFVKAIEDILLQIEALGTLVSS